LFSKIQGDERRFTGRMVCFKDPISFFSVCYRLAMPFYLEMSVRSFEERWSWEVLDIESWFRWHFEIGVQLLEYQKCTESSSQEWKYKTWIIHVEENGGVNIYTSVTFPGHRTILPSAPSCLATPGVRCIWLRMSRWDLSGALRVGLYWIYRRKGQFMTISCMCHALLSSSIVGHRQVPTQSQQDLIEQLEKQKNYNSLQFKKRSKERYCPMSAEGTVHRISWNWTSAFDL